MFALLSPPRFSVQRDPEPIGPWRMLSGARQGHPFSPGTRQPCSQSSQVTQPNLLASPPALSPGTWCFSAGGLSAGGHGPPGDAGGSRAVRNRASAPKRDSLYIRLRDWVWGGRSAPSLRPSWSLLGAQRRPLSGREQCRGLGRRPRGPHRLGFGWVPIGVHCWVRGKLAERASLSGKAKEGGRGRENESDLIHCSGDHWQNAIQIPFIQRLHTTRQVRSCRGALQALASPGTQVCVCLGSNREVCAWFPPSKGLGFACWLSGWCQVVVEAGRATLPLPQKMFSFFFW